MSFIKLEEVKYILGLQRLSRNMLQEGKKKTTGANMVMTEIQQ
jgi:hypothetical protein